MRPVTKTDTDKLILDVLDALGAAKLDPFDYFVCAAVAWVGINGLLGLGRPEESLHEMVRLAFNPPPETES